MAKEPRRLIKYKENYCKHHGYQRCDFIPCELCGLEAVDIHHIELKGMGGSKLKDGHENLIALCMDCHNRAHGIGSEEKFSKEYLRSHKK